MSKVGGVKGEFVILNCSFTSNNSKEMSVHWRNGNGKVVYDITNGTGKAGPEYEGRVTSLHEKDRNGNYFIKIERLKETDAGKYQCLITDSSTQYSEITELSVKGE